MFVNTGGQHLADIMTINPGLSAIPSASSILDTSNFSFQALTFGKDPGGYVRHAHAVTNLSAQGYILVVNYEGSTVSSYHSSATASALYPNYKLMPTPPSPYDTRLEQNSTANPFGTYDYGHNPNTAILSFTGPPTNTLLGCYPPASPVTYWFSNNPVNPSAGFYMSGTVSSFFNLYNLIDSSGYLTINSVNASAGRVLSTGSDWSGGPVRYEPVQFGTNHALDGLMQVKMFIASGDAACMALFGGLYSIGLYCLDVPAMVRSGINPPFSFSTLNNRRIYRLFAKKVFVKDLLYQKDNGTTSGFKTIPGISINLDLRFI